MTRWADDLTVRLGSVAEKVAGMETALITGNLGPGTASANELAAMISELLEELDLAPNQDPEADAELIATLRVYRNAAFAFRKLAGASGEPDPAMGAVCAAMLDQGHDHLRALMGRIPEQDQSTE